MQLDLPPVDFGGQLVDILFEVGPSGGGEVISFQEIAAWCGQTGVTLNVWESETLRRLSAAYLSEHHAAERADRPPPYSPAAKPSRAEVSKGLADLFGRWERQDRRGKRARD